jgi:hypothetical protein
MVPPASGNWSGWRPANFLPWRGDCRTSPPVGTEVVSFREPRLGIVGYCHSAVEGAKTIQVQTLVSGNDGRPLG